MKNINIIGYSGHAFVCIEIALPNDLIIDGYSDLNKKNENPYGLNYEVAPGNGARALLMKRAGF